LVETDKADAIAAVGLRLTVARRRNRSRMVYRREEEHMTSGRI